MKQLLLALALGAVPTLAAAAPPASANIMAPVPGHATTTYFDLLRQAIPDLAAKGDERAVGTLPAGIGHLEGWVAVGETPETVDIRSVETVTVRSGGKPMLWVLADLGSGGNLGTYTLLAAFDDAPVPKLLSALEVDTYQFTGFVGEPVAISAADDAMLIASEHHNSSQSYQSSMIAFLRDGQLQLIDTVYTFGTRGCELWQDESLAVTTEEGAGDYWSIFATVTRNRALAGQECEDPADSDWRHRDFTARYIWIAADQRFYADRAALDELARQDSALF